MYLVNAIRRTALAVLVTLAMLVGFAGVGAGTASAAPAASAAQASNERGVVGKSTAGRITSEVFGRASNGGRLTGTFTPTRVVQRDGALAVKGFLKGVITDRQGSKTRFSGIKVIPIKKINGQRLTSARQLQGAAQCDILNLVLGPLDLNILGLQINLQRVVLDIIAVPGPGQLLGNLLCAVAGLLDGGPLAGLLGQLRTLLNQILGLLNLGV
jgi:hypothetical protein